MIDSENGKRAGMNFNSERLTDKRLCAASGRSVLDDLNLTCKRCPDRKLCVFVDDPINFDGYCIANAID
jgi:hypothetical protein